LESVETFAVVASADILTCGVRMARVRQTFVHIGTVSSRCITRVSRVALTSSLTITLDGTRGVVGTCRVAQVRIDTGESISIIPSITFTSEVSNDVRTGGVTVASVSVQRALVHISTVLSVWSSCVSSIAGTVVCSHYVDTFAH